MTEKLEGAKPWWQSKGVIGSASAVIAGALGIWYSGIDKENIEILLTSATGLASGILSLIGRLTATKKLN